MELDFKKTRKANHLIFLLQAISFFLNLIPRKFSQKTAKGMGMVFYSLVGFRKKVIRENLNLAFGLEKTDVELEKYCSLNYQHYAQMLFEILRSINWKKEDYIKNTEFCGKENIQKLIEEKKGGVFLGTHLGNWEFAVATAAANGVPVDIVVKESKSPLGQQFLAWYRDRFGIGVFLETKTVKEIFRSINSGRFVVFILDQFMGPPIGVQVPFFGKEAGTAAGLALFCEKRDIPIFPAYNYRNNQGKLCTVIEPRIQYGDLSSDRETRIYQRTTVYNQHMESMIRKHPEQWLWLHRRWKEFKGVSRWKNSANLLLVFVLCTVWLSGCAGKAVTPTGISIPPDPLISTPKVQQEKLSEELEQDDRSSVLQPDQEKKSKVPQKPDKLSVSDKKRQTVQKTSTSDQSKSFYKIPADQIPFEVGEKVEMDLRWLAIPAGKAVLEVRQGPVINGRPTFQLWGNVLSSKLVDTIYHVDNTAESFVDQELLLPYKFLLHMVESKQNKETRVSFDHVNGKAYYWAKRISERWGNLDVDRVDELTPQAKDLWSAIYYARYLNYKLNEKQKFVVYENGQNWEVELLPVANELVTSKVGAFQCWKILVHVSLKNVLKPMGDVYMWLSDDSKKQLVKFDAKIKIGSLYGVLTSLREH